VGVMNIFVQAAEKGISYFLQFIALISIYLAIFNLLPIPALDGGKLLFLGIEAIRKKPVDPKIEQKITLFFFGLLVSLAILVTIRDILELI
jgi:regulator of sigma E protease